METVLKKIREADAYDIQILLQEVLARFQELNPGWDISTVSVEKKRSKTQQLDEIIAFLEKMKEK